MKLESVYAIEEVESMTERSGNKTGTNQKRQYNKKKKSPSFSLR